MNNEKKTFRLNLDFPFHTFSYELQKISDLAIASINSFNNFQGPYYPESLEPFYFLPWAQERISEKEIPKEFRIYIIRSGIRDALEVFFLYLCYIGTLCKSMKLKEDYDKFGNNRRIDLGQVFREFEKKHFPTKINELESKYGFNIFYKKELFSINQLRNCLVHRLGVVSKKDCKKSNSLKLKYLTFQPVYEEKGKVTDLEFGKIYSSAELQKIFPKTILKIVKLKKEFEINSTITLDKKDFFNLIFSLQEIGRLIYIDLINYANDCGLIEKRLEKNKKFRNLGIKIFKKKKK